MVTRAGHANTDYTCVQKAFLPYMQAVLSAPGEKLYQKLRNAECTTDVHILTAIFPTWYTLKPVAPDLHLEFCNLIMQGPGEKRYCGDLANLEGIPCIDAT